MCSASSTCPPENERLVDRAPATGADGRLAAVGGLEALTRGDVAAVVQAQAEDLRAIVDVIERGQGLVRRANVLELGLPILVRARWRWRLRGRGRLLPTARPFQAEPRGHADDGAARVVALKHRQGSDRGAAQTVGDVLPQRSEVRRRPGVAVGSCLAWLARAGVWRHKDLVHWVPPCLVADCSGVVLETPPPQG